MSWLVATLLAAEVPNPHGAEDQCTACHVAPGPGEEVGAALPVVGTCLGCHPDADMHPVGVAPDRVKVPEGWFLEAGVMVCSTCHEEPSHGSTLPSPWHRGGPYADVLDLCYSCHERTTYERSDPHHPQAPRDPQDDSCAACHVAEPQPGAGVEGSRLREEVSETCRTCHEGSVHAGVESHMGEEVAAEVRATLPDAVALTAEGRIGCFTCHEVHLDPTSAHVHPRTRLGRELEQQIRSEDWSMLSGADLTWPGASQAEHPSLLGLPASDGALCRACHGEGP